MGEVLGSAVTLSESHLSDEDAMALPLQHESMTLTQTLISGPDEKLNRRIPIVIMKESKLKAEDLAAFDHTGPIGISVGYEEGSKGKVLALAIVDENQGLLIELNGKKGNGWRNSTSNSKRGQARRLLEETVLCRAIAPLVGFDMAPLVLSICNSFGLVVSNAIDVQDTFSPDDRNELVTVKTAMGEGFIAMSPKERNIERLFTSRFYDPEERRCKVELASKAWLAQLLVAEFLPQEARETVRRIDLGKLDERKVIV
ncbi:hypothetical protein FA15DRAFT_94088 [Coprinopsis marcescibilis]|uniref:3'-5' exonuclease domain-containing protein n=1 Tax=Coprinopsis marcescibilis TaxID=230819 RepID=A0A5C3KMC9_COPMA|nr:hypothetical protein FA15DRAFT_94088 [Coprinopsis marcescibilis]